MSQSGYAQSRLERSHLQTSDLLVHLSRVRFYRLYARTKREGQREPFDSTTMGSGVDIGDKIVTESVVALLQQFEKNEMQLTR